MTLQDLGSIGEFTAAIATLATLVYLALQIRQNTRSVRAASRLEIASGWRAHNRLSMNPEASRTYAEGLLVYPAMPFAERSLFGTMFIDHAVFFQGAFVLHEEGQLDQGTYQDYLTWFACQVATPGGAMWWKENSGFLVKGAVAAVDAKLGEAELPDITQTSGFRLDDASPIEGTTFLTNRLRGDPLVFSHLTASEGRAWLPLNKAMKRTLNSSARIPAVPSGTHLLWLGDHGGAIQRRLSPIRWAAWRYYANRSVLLRSRPI